MASAEETEKLLEATQANDVETARAALAAGADPNGQSQNNWMLSGRPAPLVAAEFGSLDVLKLLLDHGAKKDAKDGSDNTMVHKAAKAGKEEMLRYLLEELKLDANAVTTDNDTALHQAVRYCQFATVKMLVDHGADISTKDEYGNTLLHSAGGNVDMVKLFLDRGIAVNEPGQAVKCGYSDVIELLVNAGGDVNLTENSYTLAHFATSGCKPDVLKALLKNGCNANRKTEDGASLLHCIDASQYNPEAVEVTKLVLQVPGLDINEAHSGYPNLTPLQNVSLKQGPVAAKVAQLLIEAGADVNAATKESKMTALHWAAENYNVDLIKTLLASGADKKAKNADGKVPLDLVPDEDADAKGRGRTRALLEG